MSANDQPDALPTIGLAGALSIGLGGIVGGGFFATYGLTIVGATGRDAPRLPDRRPDRALYGVFLYRPHRPLSGAGRNGDLHPRSVRRQPAPRQRQRPSHAQLYRRHGRLCHGAGRLFGALPAGSEPGARHPADRVLRDHRPRAGQFHGRVADDAPRGVLQHRQARACSRSSSLPASSSGSSNGGASRRQNGRRRARSWRAE